MSYPQTVFRLKTSLESLIVGEPNVIVNPTVAEPVRWSDIELIGEVDELFHGFNYNYAKGDISLQLTCEAGQQLVRDQYAKYGVDALVQFLVVEIDRAGIEEVVYDGKIRYDKNYTEEKKYAFVTVSLNSIHEKVTSRWDTKISLTANRTLDDVFISPPVEIEIPLNGQTLHEQGQTFIQKKRYESVVFNEPGIGLEFFVYPNMIPPKEDTTTPNTNTTSKIPALETLKGVSLLYGSASPINPIDNNPLLTVTNDNGGQYHIEIDWQFVINVVLTKKSLQIGKAKFSILRFSPFIVIRIPGLPDNYIPFADSVSANGFVNSVEEGFNCKYSNDLDLPVGSQVYVFCKVQSFSVQETKQQEVEITTINVRVYIDRRTNAIASRTKAYGYVEALRHVVGSITSELNDDGTGLVIGDVLDAASNSQALDGFLREFAVSSGKQIRGLSKPPSFSAKDLMLFASSQCVAGMLYEKDPITGKESIHIEPGEWFYRGGEIMQLNEIYEYSETPDVDFLERKIVVGYEKYPTEGAGVGEEFNTEHTYQTPIVNSENTLQIKSPLIAAGTAIEIQRRLGSKKTVDGVEVSTENDAGTYDDDVFVLHVINNVFTDSVKFLVEPPTPAKPYSANYIQFQGNSITRQPTGPILKEGDVIVLNGTGTPNDGLFFLVLEVVSNNRLGNRPTYRVFYQGFVQDNVAHACTWQIQGQPFKLRTNERVDVVGLTDPANTPNIELSPARMLRRWALFINSGLFHKKAISQLKCTEFKGNESMMTRVKDNAMPLPGDPFRQPVFETKDVALGELQKFNKLFRPELINVKCKMTRLQVRALFDAMKNRGDEAKRLGYLTFVHPETGILVSGYVRQFSYKKSEQTATMTLRKRRMEIDVPQCEYYFDWQLNRFVIDPTANPDKYLFCQFQQLKPV